MMWKVTVSTSASILGPAEDIASARDLESGESSWRLSWPIFPRDWAWGLYGHRHILNKLSIFFSFAPLKEILVRVQLSSYLNRFQSSNTRIFMNMRRGPWGQNGAPQNGQEERVINRAPKDGPDWVISPFSKRTLDGIEGGWLAIFVLRSRVVPEFSR